MFEPIQDDDQENQRTLDKIFYSIVAIFLFGMLIWSIVSLSTYYRNVS
jgi:hypothetical protein